MKKTRCSAGVQGLETGAVILNGKALSRGEKNESVTLLITNKMRGRCTPLFGDAILDGLARRKLIFNSDSYRSNEHRKGNFAIFLGVNLHGLYDVVSNIICNDIRGGTELGYHVERKF